MFNIGISTIDRQYEIYLRKLMDGIMSGYEEIVYESIPVEVLTDRQSGKFLDIQMFA